MKTKKWSFKNLNTEAKKYSTRTEFFEHSSGAYQAARNMGILDSICTHMIIKHYSWPLDALKNEAKKYTSRGEFQKNSFNAYQIALKREMLDVICNHMDLKRREWTNLQLHQEALKYGTRKDFENYSRKAYDLALKRNMMDLICGHMIRLIRTDWTDADLYAEALKYNTRSEFKNSSPSAYRAGKRKNILPKMCGHMKRSGGVSRCEQELFDAITSTIPTARKIRDVNVKIEGKPHIKGFDIDIFIDKSNLGIEMDGKYWHSVKGLSRSRKDWPKEDLVNYHQIKDAHFLSKGIKILHIKEEEWSKDKQDCIKRCLEFLEQKNG
jgi:very-short-patch-repair endonuclease